MCALVSASEKYFGKIEPTQSKLCGNFVLISGIDGRSHPEYAL